MAARKRASSRSRQSGLVGRAVSAGRKAFHEAESRVPPDVRRQLERSIKDGQRTLKAAIDQLQVQVRRTAKQADVDKALKRLEGLTKQVQKLAIDAATRGAARASSTTRSASSTARRTTSTAKRRAAATRKSATRKAPARSSTTRRAAPSVGTTRAAAPRRSPRRRPASPSSEGTAVQESPPMPESGEISGSSF
ncbi:MAG TPA: hypothetical protein VHJ99_03590 [Candidatus Dormibacteraeota bacterium]|nr:hypothetical protein [Candidatus Dormibacteraeota bacterium]